MVPSTILSVNLNKIVPSVLFCILIWSKQTEATLVVAILHWVIDWQAPGLGGALETTQFNPAMYTDEDEEP